MSSTVIAIVVVLVLLATVLAGFAWYHFFYRRRSFGDAEKGQKVRDIGIRPISTWTVGPTHPASRITPFGTRDASRPGENMRTARRRDDGVWEFFDADPQTALPPRVYDPSIPRARSSLSPSDMLSPRLSIATHLSRSTSALDSMPPTPTSVSSSAWGAQAAAKDNKDGAWRTEPGAVTNRVVAFDEPPPPPAYTVTRTRPAP